MSAKIVVLAGGVGAARFLDGLAHVIQPKRIFVIGNTGDDAVIHGLHISPDLDTVTYMLSGIANRQRGWGIRGDTFRCLESLSRLGAETWFHLGDRDLATHLYRTRRMSQGASLSQVTQEIASALHVRATIAPMSDHPVRTIVETPRGDLEFQTYFVRRRARDRVTGLRFEGVEGSSPAPGVLSAINGARAVIVCPSNPFISIGPILAVPGIRNALASTSAPIAAISPIVGGRALKGPAARMMKSMGMRASPVAVAEIYLDFVDHFVLDSVDARYAARIEALGLRTLVTNTIMSGPAQRKALARSVLRALEIT